MATPSENNPSLPPRPPSPLPFPPSTPSKRPSSPPHSLQPAFSPSTSHPSSISTLLTTASPPFLHLNRILSTPTGLDTTLLTLTYTLHLLHSRLSLLPTLSTPAPTAKHPTPPSKAPLALRPHLAHTVRGMSKLADLIDDFRIFLRLWGLLGILAWARSVSETPPRDTLLHTIAWAQIVVNTLYQLLENGAYLASHHVLPWSEQKVNRWYLWSSRFWMGHVGLEFVRLAREWALGKQVAAARGGKAEELGAKLERVREEGRWWREVCVNAAYAPLTVHWSVEGGWVGEGVVGGLGMVAGWVGLRELWRRTG